MNILETMNITKEKHEAEILPIDDIGHCPPGLRITDGVAKCSINQSKQKKRKRRPSRPLKRIVAYRYNKEISRGVISEVAEGLMISRNTICSALSRNGKIRNGYSFKVITDEP